jgi:predicted DNA-binding transcriptional regulator AlpA
MQTFLFASSAVFAPADEDRPTRPRLKRRLGKAEFEGVERSDRPSLKRNRAESDSRPQSRAAENDRGPVNRKKNTQRQARRDRLQIVFADHSLRLYRPTRLAALLDVNESTIWRWRRDGRLPEPVTVAGVTGWTHDQIAALLKADPE